MARQRITIISIYYPPEQGAAASRIAKLASGLLARNVDVNVVTALPNYPKGRIFSNYRGKIAVSEVLEGIPIRRYWLYASNSKSKIKRILNMISFSAMLLLAFPHLRRMRPEMIIVNSPPLLVGFAGVTLARILRTSIIANISDIWPMSALELGALHRGRFYSLLERIEGYIYRHSDAILTQSTETLDHIVERCPGTKAFLYRNLDYKSDYIDNYPPMHDRPLRLVYAGLLGVAQGVYDLCRSIDFPSLGAELHLYGNGNERADLVRYIEETPGCGIYLHDMVRKEEMPALLSQYHATIVPLKTDIRGAFPSKIYMAIAAALPVFFCGSGEGAKFVNDTRVGWVSPPGDYDGLRDNIEILDAMSNQDYDLLRKHIKSLATGTFDPDEQLDHLIEFIEAVR